MHTLMIEMGGRTSMCKVAILATCVLNPDYLVSLFCILDYVSKSGLQVEYLFLALDSEVKSSETPTQKESQRS